MADKFYHWYNSLSKQVRDSIIITANIISAISIILSILGISLGDWKGSSIGQRIVLVFFSFLILGFITYIVIGKIFKKTIKLTIRQTTVFVRFGNIFETDSLRVIGCDTHFDTRVNDVIIAKNSLHGQLVSQYGKKEEIEKVVNAEALRLGLEKNQEGFYNFPLGTIIPYKSGVDNQTYLLLAMTELNNAHEAHTNMAKYEQMLMKMWKEINRVYANCNVVLPLLGAGITRFDCRPKCKEDLLKCMLCTFNSSGVSFNSNIEILISDDMKNTPLYEYKDMFHSIPRR